MAFQPTYRRYLVASAIKRFTEPEEETFVNNGTAATIENHRSRDRIMELGEVFTPEQYVQQMLALIDRKLWGNENSIFFEPSCGHGNIVLAILEKRILILKKKYVRANLDEPTLHAVANALHTLWAIDICPVNVELTRTRVLSLLMKFLEIANYDLRRTKIRDFLAHILCTLVWQIQHNEALSALSVESAAEMQAGKIKLGEAWINTHKHKPIDFSLDWCTFYKQSTTTNAASLLFRRAQRFLESSSKNEKVRGYEEFRFAKETLESSSEKRQSVAINKGVA